MRKFDRAIEDYSEAIRLNPRSEQAYLDRGTVRAQTGEFTGRSKIAALRYASTRISCRRCWSEAAVSIDWATTVWLLKNTTRPSASIRAIPKLITIGVQRSARWANSKRRCGTLAGPSS